MSDIKCTGCARKCNAIRNEENGSGVCKMPMLPVIAKACLHYGEEPCISGKNGSGTVFFSGCSLKCVFCQNYDVSHNGFGKKVSVERLAEIYKELEQKGANNINLVTPSHYVDAIIESLNIYRPNIPIVYNASGYDSRESIEKLKDYIDVYLIDFKFYSDERAMRYADAPNYSNVAKECILTAYDNINGEYILDENGIIKKGLIVRHLIMPQGTNDANEIIKWCAKNVPNSVFSIMSQYLPCGEANDFKELTRRITKREYDKVLDTFSQCQFKCVYTQNLSSSTEEYIPDFNLEGV